ncbi:MAG: folylpolyglutamate synthase/dihydrofolate synthase family protein [Actinomycetota bacterium]
MDYDEAIAWLYGHVNLEQTGPRRPGELSLDGLRRLMGVLGDPQDTAPTIHITGTNGKGSTARVVTALLVELGLTVGTATSPHLQRINERIRVDGVPITDEEFARAVELVASVQPLSGVDNSYFEVLAALTYAFFADVPTSANVIEVGAGGRHDATNVVHGEVAVVTNVGLDHLDYFGPTIHHVAAEKAGIIEPGAHLVLGETDPELRHHFVDEGPGTVWTLDDEIEVLRNEVAIGGRVIDVRTPMATYSDVFLPLHGAHQGVNAALGLAAVEAFVGRALGGDVVEAALSGVRAPGRFEVVDRQPLILLDGAHNTEGAAAAAATYNAEFAIGGDTVLVFGCNTGREPAEVLHELARIAPRLVIATAPDWVRAVPPTDIAELARAEGLDVEVVPRVPDAVDRARALTTPDDAIFVTGSLYVVGEAREHLGLSWDEHITQGDRDSD